MYPRVESLQSSHNEGLLISLVRGKECPKISLLLASLLVWSGSCSSAAPPSLQLMLVSAGEFLLGNLVGSSDDGRALLDLRGLASRVAVHSVDVQPCRTISASTFLDMGFKALLQANSHG